jgi:ATP-dependent DNA helicase RecG
MLIARADIDLWSAILLDKVQKKILIDKNQFRLLKQKKLVEGRYPNIYISASIAKAIGESAQHIRNSGLDMQYYKNLIYELIRKHQPVTREDIDKLLFDKLPVVLSEIQKKNRIHNYLSNLANEGRIANIASRKKSKWVIVSVNENNKKTIKKQ